MFLSICKYYGRNLHFFFQMLAPNCHRVLRLRCFLSQLLLAEGGAASSLTFQAVPSPIPTEPGGYVFQKATKRLISLFPDYSRCWWPCAPGNKKSPHPCVTISTQVCVCACVFRGELKKFIQEFRSSGGTLHCFSVENLVSEVSNLILNRQVRL